MSNITDMKGLIPTGKPVGIELHRASKNAICTMIDYVNEQNGSAFIDSGAFEAFRTGRVIDVDVVVGSYLDIMSSVKEDRRANLFMVAPDILGDQLGTLVAQRRYAQQLRDLITQGVTVLVPIHRGDRSFIEVYDYLCEILDTNNFAVSIPSNKEPWKWDEVREFVAYRRPMKIHFLGISPRRGRKYERYRRLVEKCCGKDAQMSSAARSLRSFMRASHDLKQVIDTEIELNSKSFREINHEADTGYTDYSEVDFTEWVGSVYREPGFLTTEEADVLGFYLGIKGRSRHDFAKASQQTTTPSFHRQMVENGWWDYEGASDDDPDPEVIHFESRLGYWLQTSTYDPCQMLNMYASRFEKVFRDYRRDKHVTDVRINVRKNAISRHYSDKRRGLVHVGDTNYEIDILLKLGYSEEQAIRYLNKFNNAPARASAIYRISAGKSESLREWILDLDVEDFKCLKWVTGMTRDQLIRLAGYFSSYEEFSSHIDRIRKSRIA
ncbi:MAG: hypothetical protein HQL31_04055 [Planctomycetes bacterium]|nr:hypothetical protein [Planctomycetota bacterium]